MLDKKKSAALHGIAILMMIYHHLFISGNGWAVNEGTSLLSIFDRIDLSGSGSAQLCFAWFCRICVAIFAFTSGYALFMQLEKKRDMKEMFVYLIKRFWSFYKKYFIAFVFFVGCSYLFMGDVFDFSLNSFILSLLGFEANYNSTLWYVRIYYLMLIVSPFFYILLKRINVKGYLFCGVLFGLSLTVAGISGNFMPYLKQLSLIVQYNAMTYILIFAEGMFCARYSLIDIIGSRLNAVTSIIVLVAVYVLRSMLIRAASDPLFDLVLITPYIIASARLLSYSDRVTAFFGYFGKYSAYMWYSHAYFYSYLFFVYVERFDASLLVYLQVVFYSLVCGIAFTAIEDKLSKRSK